MVVKTVRRPWRRHRRSRGLRVSDAESSDGNTVVQLFGTVTTLLVIVHSRLIQLEPEGRGINANTDHSVLIHGLC